MMADPDRLIRACFDAWNGHDIWARCGACGSLEDVSDDHRACRRCGAELAERPAFW
jgi:hypothetical protein